MRVVITGGAGFLGSHLADSIVNRGDDVVCVDNLLTGDLNNIAHLLDNPRFEFRQMDVSDGLPVDGPVDAVAHLASTASPPDYYRYPLETLAAGSRGTEHALRLADRWGARFVEASTSEVYGDPAVHPQEENYWGNVNPIGPRSVYDEAKRYAEALVSAYRRTVGVNTGIVRIFNTYGPRMRPNDGRVVSSFIANALNGDPLTVHGDGSQTRSFCYVDDLIRGLVAMIDSDEPGPVNLGNPEERTINELAEMILAATGSSSKIEHAPLPDDDPTRRKPDISLARERLGWSPQVSVEDGLRQTIKAFGSSARKSGSPKYPTAATVGQTYYIDPEGDDAADGRSPGSAWKTLNRANSVSFRPGDRLRLRGGARFTGMLYLEREDAGDADRPVVIESFGDGRATIQGDGNSAIYLYNTAGVAIRNLTLVGDPHATAPHGGLVLYNDTDARLKGVSISGVEVSGFTNGIEIGGKKLGFADVSVTNSELHGNIEAGLATYGPALAAEGPGYAHQNVTVSRVQAHDNSGDAANKTRNTGSGIMLGSVDGGRVEWSHAYRNGWSNAAPEGPVGIWAYDSTKITIERNVAHHNKTGTTADGDGFDLDQNTSDSVMQYNLSYGNDGAGFLLYAERDGTFNRNNVIRYNISRDTSRKTDWYGSVAVMGHVENAQIYGNTFIMTKSEELRPPVVRLKGAMSNIGLRNNILVSDGAGPMVDASMMSGDTTTLQGNNYYVPSGDWRIRWGDETFDSLDELRKEAGQERDGKRNTGVSVDPKFVDGTATLPADGPGDLATASGLKLTPSSLLADAGVDLRALSIDPGPVDYFGTRLDDTPADIGAHAVSGTVQPPSFLAVKAHG